MNLLRSGQRDSPLALGSIVVCVTGAARRLPLLQRMIALGLVAGSLGCGLLEPRRPVPAMGDLQWQEEPSATGEIEIVDRWILSWVGDRPRLDESEWSAPRGGTLILGIRGGAPDDEVSSEAIGELVVTVEKTVRDLQNQGAQVSGLHLDLSDSGPTNLDALAQFYDGLREELDSGLELSASLLALDEQQLSAEVEAVRGTADWFLVQLYGQDYGVADNPALWDLDRALDRYRAVARAEVPARGLVRLTGSLKRLHDGNATPISNWLGCELLSDLGRRADAVFQFEGYFRQVFEADARDRVVAVGDTTVSLTGKIQVNRTTPDHLRKLREAVIGLPNPQHLGLVYADVSQDPSNCLGVDQERLMLAMSPVAAVPTVELSRLPSGTYELVLNSGSEPTALGRKLYNYVDVVADAGVVDRVDTSGFARYEFLGPDLEPIAGFGGRGVRLFLPMLEPGTSARATLRARGHRELAATPLFRATTGDELESNSVGWPLQTTSGTDS